MTTMTLATREQYEAAFARECGHQYPVIDMLEARYGYALPRPELEAVARVLACPVKANPPNWQHGRVLYAAARHRAAQLWNASTGRAPHERMLLLLDIGTAKGFSAWCLHRALIDAHAQGTVTSLDVIDPASIAPRNSIADCDGPHSLRELHRPWPEMWAIQFVQSTGLDWLRRHYERVHVAFVDGKHDGTIVYQEGKALAARQVMGDLAIFDDVHLPALAEAVTLLGQQYYRFDYVKLLPQREYAIGVRR